MKKIFLVLFSLILMCSVSFGLEANVHYSNKQKTTSNIPTMDFSHYTQQEISNILYNISKYPTNEDYIEVYDKLISDLKADGYKYIAYKYDNEYWILIKNPDSTFELNVGVAEKYGSGNSYSKYKLLAPMNVEQNANGIGCYMFAGRLNLTKMHSYGSWNGSYNYIDLMMSEFLDSNMDIYLMSKIDPNSTSSRIYWEGTDYFYKHTSSGGDTGDIPEDVTDLTDEQIAEIVERFINSDAYLEKAYYNGDYFITYDNLTGYFRGYSYAWNIDLAIEYGNYNDEGEFITTGTKEGEAYRIRPYEFSGDIFNKFGDWLASKFNTYAFEYFSISPDSTIKPRYVGSLEHNYCSNYKENELVIYSSKQIRYVGEETDEEGKTETVITDNYIPPTILKDSVTGEQIVIRDNLQNSSDSLENVITPNADFSGLKQAFEKYISFVNISSITWLTTAISSMITIFVPFVALGIIIFLINRILNGGS